MNEECDRDDRAVIANILAGDRDAFRTVVARHQRQVYAVAFSLLSDHHDADEIAQETFVQAYRHLASFRGDANLSTWLHRIATNLSLTLLRRQRRHQSRHVTLDHPDAIRQAEELNTEDPDRQRLLERILHELPTMQRAVVILRHLQGRSTRQVSEALGLSEGTVKTHLHRGLLSMRRKLTTTS
jgi:RNA polymerase sigma-70 factor (ECF subfamily)